ncbi:RNA polymerase sigma factor [Nonomuraea bangladeshensis]|uniref:RNA polymerase sigma factor n=1 Tax=Nonomuraea bangladeshensis TaxID=404385 RepID=UPI003C2EB5C7
MDDDRKIRFEAVYRQTYDRILGYAVRRCDSPEDAADVVAETFAIAWRRVDALPPGEEARLWLYGVARNVLANHRRGEHRRHAHVVAFDAGLAELYARSPSPAHDLPADLEAVAQALAVLSDDDRELISLVAWEGLDHGEIAAVLGCSRNAVRIRLHRARRRLTKALAAAGVPAGRIVMETV